MTMSIDKTKEIKTTTYAINSDIYKDFYVDIVDDGEKREAWIWHKGYGVKSMDFGSSKDQDTLESFLEVVKANAEESIEFFLMEMKEREEFFEQKYFAKQEV